jgi:hypothetical protein
MERARLLFGFYPKGQANDPDTYVLGIAALLADYPEDVIAHVTDVRTGIPSQVKWLPVPKEVKDACELQMDIRRARVKAAQWQAQLKARRALPPPPKTSPPGLTYIDAVRQAEEIKARVREG